MKAAGLTMKLPPILMLTAASIILVTSMSATSAGLRIEQRKIEQGKIGAIDSMVEELFGSGQFPSLSVGLVKDDELVYARALGVADKGTDRPASIETIYELGSVGKVLTSTVLAILDDRRVVKIDDPVQEDRARIPCGRAARVFNLWNGIARPHPGDRNGEILRGSHRG